MACEPEVIRDLIPRLRGIDVPKLCGDAYRHCFKRGRESTETIQDSIAAEEREAAARVRQHRSPLHRGCQFSRRVAHLFSQAKSVMSAKDRYLQRKAGASPAAAHPVKKEQNGTESSTKHPDAAVSSSVRVKKEPEVSAGGVAIKRE
jgi:hypothetical protein